MSLADSCVLHGAGNVTRMFDVFICYNWDDKPLADELHDALEERDVRVFQDDKKIDFGDTLLPKLRDALFGSRMLVPLVTPTFHESASCRKELLTALTAAYRLEKGFTERIMPVAWRVRPSELRPRQLKHPKLLRREEHDVAELADAIAAKVTRIRDSDNRRFGDAPWYPEPEWWPVPLPANKRFQGRGELMWEIHEALLVKDKPGNRAQPVVVVRGEGGQGKTALCEKYAQLFAEDHPGGVFVIRLEGSDRGRPSDVTTVMTRLHQQLGQIAERLGPHVRADSTEGLAAVIGHELRERKPYLWLVDDVPSTVDQELLRRLWAPTSNGKTLITTRGRFHGALSGEFELEPLTERESVAVLTAAHPLAKGRSDERTAAAGIATDLGHNALGLTIAAGLTRLPDFTGYQALRDGLRLAVPDSLEMAAHLTEIPLGFREAFSATMLRSFHALSDAGRDVLAVCSVLGSAPLPLDLVDEVLTRPSLQGFTRMEEHGLAMQLGDDFRSVHALVARAARFFFPVEHRRRFHAAAAELIGDSLEATRDRYDRARALAARLPHVIALATTSEWMPGTDEWHGLNEVVRMQTELGDTAGALYAAKILHRSCQTSPHADEDTKSVVLVSLGAAHFGQGEYTEAKQVQQEAVRRFEALYDADHESTLQARENLANTLGKLGEHAAAKAQLRRVYRIRSRTKGPTSRRALISLNNFVLAVDRAGASKLGLRLGLGAWARWHRTVGPDAPETLEVVEAIGNCLFHLGWLPEAEATYLYVAAKRKDVLGPKHPDTLDAEENALTARRQSQWPTYVERLKVQGPGHLDTLQTLSRLLKTSLREAPRSAEEATGDEPGLQDDLAPRLEGDHTELLADLIEAAVALEDQESAHGADDPRALRAKVLLAHAMAAADQLDGQIETARVIVEDSRDGLEEVGARRPDDVDPADLEVAKIVHHWILDLMGEEPDY
ncbi:TIR domain-containing protein [Lentzea sp. NPDC055074]